MKAFSYFFIFYIFVLLAQPCQDMAANVGDCLNGKLVSLIYTRQTKQKKVQTFVRLSAFVRAVAILFPLPGLRLV